MDTYTLPYVKSIASGNLLYDAGTSTQLMRELNPHLEGWGGVGGGNEIQEERDICIPMTD